MECRICGHEIEGDPRILDDDMPICQVCFEHEQVEESG